MSKKDQIGQVGFDILDDALDRMQEKLIAHFSPWETALREAGQTLDEALRTLEDKGCIRLLHDAVLVDKMHAALENIDRIVGMPWRQQL